jgi:hypothetical protein
MDVPYNRAVPIVTSDTVNIVDPARDPLPDAIYVGGAGVVAAVFQDNTVVNFTAVAGEMLPIRIKRVNSTGTTATVMVALSMV